MATRFTLRTFGVIELATPTVDRARESLGGRASTDADAGQRVRMTDDAREGVVVFASGGERDVWIGEGRIRRARVELCEPSGSADVALDAVAIDARRFATLAESAEVGFLDRAGGVHAGTLVEKCRYGALVLASDGKIVAVSFRRLAPRAATAS